MCGYYPVIRFFLVFAADGKERTGPYCISYLREQQAVRQQEGYRMVTISLCMIVKNEEEVLGRCLESVKDLADEIIIVDTGSEDRTKEIASRFTDKIHDFPWQDDFAAARNFAFSKASMDYQMWLDADDVILPKDREDFRKMKKEFKKDVDMVMLPYHVAFDENGNPSMTYYRERLMRRERGYVWQGAVHEVVVPAGNIVYGTAAVCHKKLHASDPDRNLRIYESMKERGQITDPRHQFYYGRELLYHGRYGEAADVLEHFLKEGKGWLENEISACLNLSECYEKLGQGQKALDSLLLSFRYDVPRPEACCAVGRFFLEQGRLEEAVYWYEGAKTCKDKGQAGGFTNPDCRGFIPDIQLCVCYDRMGDREKAIQYHEMAKALKPDDPAVAYNEAYFFN